MSSNEEMPSLTIIAPLPAPRRRQRLAKMIPFYQSAKYELHFWGWDRIRGEAKQWAWQGDPVNEKTILVGGGYSGARARALYPVWIGIVFFRVLFAGRRRLFHCLGWESAFPAMIAGLLTGSKVIFDDADRFSLVLGLRGFPNRILQRLEKWTSERALVHIIPGWSRYDWCDPSMFVLRNTPTRADYEDASKIEAPEKTAALTMYANGWLPPSRGIGFILDTFEVLKARGLDVHLIIAGFVLDEFRERITAMTGTTYYGEVSQRDALALYGQADIVLTFYDPLFEINQKAEPNKWGDCVFLRKPFVVNSEVRTARDFIEKCAAWEVPYGDRNALAELLNRLHDNPDEIAKANEALGGLQSDFSVFDDQMKLLLRKTLQRLGREA